MERPFKRQRLSSDSDSRDAAQLDRPSIQDVVADLADANTIQPPTRASRYRDTQDFAKRNPQAVRRREIRHVVLPRIPDVTVTASAIEVIVNDALSTVVPAAATDLALPMGSMGTLTISAQLAASAPAVTGLAATSDLLSASLTDPSLASITTNSTLFASTSTDHTATITATSTLHLSNNNGTFFNPSSTRFSNSNSTFTGRSSSQVTLSKSIGVPTLSPTYSFGDITLTDGASSVTALPTGQSYAGSSTASSATSPTSTGSTSGIAPLTPKQTQVVGGVVGGFAGIALVLMFLLFVLRRYRAHLEARGRLRGQNDSVDHLPFNDAALITSDDTPPATKEKLRGFPSAAFALTKLGSKSESTASRAASTSEKSFQRLSGRKIPSVLTYGGDGYGEHPSHSTTNLINSPFDHDSFAASPPPLLSQPLQTPFSHDTTTPQRHRNTPHGTPPCEPYKSDFAPITDTMHSPTAFSPSSMSRHIEGYAAMRSSPARTPVTQSPVTSHVPIPMSTQIVMDHDVPEMPLSPTQHRSAGGWQVQHETTHSGSGLGLGLGLDRNVIMPRAPSRVSARSGNTGRFKEDI